MSSVFLSYARRDDTSFVERLYHELKATGIEAWWDHVSMPSRSLTFLQEIRDAIEGHERVVLVIGPGAVASDYVRSEWQYALVADKIVIPVLRLGDFDLLPPELKNLDCIDFREGKDHESAFKKLLADLRAPLPRLGRLLGVPSPPPHFRPRSPALSEVASLVLRDLRNPVVLAPAERTTVIHGMGGVGKSVLAATFARSTETRRAFADGLFWLDLRSAAPLSSMLGSISRQLGGDERDDTSDALAREKFARAIAQKACLVVLDNATSVEEVEPLINAISQAPRTHLLITTREGSLVSSLGCQEIDLRELAEQAALESLADWAGQDVDSLPAQARDVARECSGLPFALALCGAMVKDGNTWADLLGELKHANLAFIEGRQLNYPFPDLLKCFKVSMDLLDRGNPEALVRYRELVVFAHGAEIPESAVLTLWLRDGSLRAPGARKLLVVLERKALVRLEGSSPDRLVTLHDLQHDYLEATTSREHLILVHAALVEAYAASCPDDWPTGPRDGYFHRHLIHHLECAGRIDEIHRLLALSTRDGLNAWYEAWRSQQDVTSYRADAMHALELSARQHLSLPRDQRAQNLGRQVRYVLCISSVNTWLPTLPSELVAALTEKGIWSSEQALRYATQNPRADALIALARVLPEPAWPALYELVAVLPEGLSRTEALVGLASASPRTQRTDACRAALAALLAECSSESWDYTREQALLKTGALDRLILAVPEELLEETVAAIEKINFPPDTLVANLVARLPLSALSRLPERVLAVARRLSSGAGSPPAPDPAATSPAPSNAREALDQALAIRGDAARAVELATLAAVLPDPLKNEALQEAVRSATSIESHWIQAKTLLAIEPFCDGEYLDAISKAARSLDASDSRVRDYLARMPCLSGPDPLARFDTARQVLPRLPQELRAATIREGLEALGQMNGRQALRALSHGALDPAWNEAVPRFADLVPGLEGEERVQLAVAVKPFVSEARWAQLVRAIMDDAALAPRSILVLLPHLEGLPLKAALDRAIEIFRRTATHDDREVLERWLATQAPRLPRELLAQALNLAQSIGDRAQIARLRLNLAPHLPDALFDDTLDVIPDAALDTGHLLDDRNYFPEDIGTTLPARPAAKALAAKSLQRILALDWPPIRIECLLILARHWPADGAAGVGAALVDAWKEAVLDDFPQDYRLLQALKSILPHLGTTDLDDILAVVARRPERAFFCARALCLIGPMLPPPKRGHVFSDAVRVIETMDEKERISHFVELADCFSDPERSRAVERAIAWIESALPSSDGYDYTIVSALQALGAKLDPERAERALDWLKRLHAESDARLLASLFVSLSAPGRLRCLAIARSLKKRDRAEALVALLPHAPDGERAGLASEALDALVSVLEEVDRAQVSYRRIDLEAIGLGPSAEHREVTGEQNEALQDALSMSEAEDVSDLLQKLDPYLDRNSRQTVLTRARSTPDKASSIVLIAGLGPTLPEVEADDADLLARTWHRARPRGWLLKRAAAAISRIPEPQQFELWVKLSPLGLGDIAILADGMSQVSREVHVGAALSYLEKNLTEIENDSEQASDVFTYLPRLAAACSDAQRATVLRLALALEPACTGQQHSKAVGRLESVAGCAARIPEDTLFPAWHSLLGLFLRRDRPSLLDALLGLCPVLVALGGQAGAAAIDRSLKDVQRWWP